MPDIRRGTTKRMNYINPPAGQCPQQHLSTTSPIISLPVPIAPVNAGRDNFLATGTNSTVSRPSVRAITLPTSASGSRLDLKDVYAVGDGDTKSQPMGDREVVELLR